MAPDSLIAPARTRRGGPLVAAALALALVAAMLLAVRFGARPLSWAELRPGSAGLQLILEQRLPRVLAALLVGAALAVAGALMQTATQNPLAGPSLMGLGPGAALAMLSALALGQPDAPALAWISFAGAAGGGGLVFAVAAASRRGATPERLVLAGAVVGAFLTSITSMLVLRLQLQEVLLLWTAGGFSYLSWTQLLWVLPLLLPGFALAVGVARPLTLLLGGDEQARSLGVHTGRVRALTSLAVLFLAGGAAALAGPIGFVGVLVPNLCRPFAGPELRRLLPLAALGGACLVVLADLLSRQLVGSLMDAPVGVLSALLGAPVMIWIARRGLA